MRSPSVRKAFARLRQELNLFASQHDACAIDHDSEKAILLRFGSGDRMSFLEAYAGSFEITGLDPGWDYEILETDRDVDRALAICEAIVAGRGVSISGPGGYPVRSWLFLNSRGHRETMTSTAVSLWSCRRARSIKKSAWDRTKLPVLTSKTV